MNPIAAVWQCLLFLCAFGAGFSAFAAEPDWRFTHVISADKSPPETIGQVLSIVKDAEGFMWLGGESGLARFNGRDFEVFRHQPQNPASLGENYITKLLLDHSHTLWVAGGPVLNQFNPQQKTFTRYNTQHNGQPLDFIRDLAEAPDHSLWLATKGLHWLDARRQIQPSVPAFDHVDASALAVEPAARIWVGTRSHGLARWDRTTQEATWIPLQQHAQGLPVNDIRALQFIAPHTLWVGTFGAGVFKINTQTLAIQHYPRQVPDQRIRNFTQDKHGQLWMVSDGGGLEHYNPKTDQFEAHQAAHNSDYALTFAKATGLFADPDNGDIWIGLFPYGVDLLNQSANVIEHITAAGNGLADSGILSLVAGDNNTLWVGTEKGLNLYHPEHHTIATYSASRAQTQPLRASAVTVLAKENAHLWVGTWGGGLHRLNTQTQQLEYVPLDHLPSSYIWALLVTRSGQLYVGGEWGGLCQRQAGFTFSCQGPNSQNPHAISDEAVNVLTEDSQGHIWVGTAKGLDEYHPETGRFSHIPLNVQPPLKDIFIGAIYEDSQQRLWLATRNHGVIAYHPGTGELTHYTQQQGLPSDYVVSILGDAQGAIWATTNHGVARIDPITGAILTLSKSEGLIDNHFNRNATWLDPQGYLYLGGATGINRFHPDTYFEHIKQAPKVLITNVLVFNKVVPIGQEKSILPKAVNYLDRITLNHKQVMLGLDYAALEYRSPQKIQYAYQLEGFDKDWNQVGNNTRATYTNLPPGDYTFKVKVKDFLGHWSPQESHLRIQVLPAPWRSLPAYTLYGLVFCALVLAIARRLRQKRLQQKQRDAAALIQEKERLELESEKRLNTKLQQVDKLKDAFLANTSHELRTPLNGIIGLSDGLIEGAHGPISPAVRDILEMISISGRRLSYLINDILDYSKLSKRDLDLNIQPMSVSQSARLIVELVRPLLAEKPLQLINRIPRDAPFVRGDANRIQQVLINLLGNAIKFTQQGQVVLQCRSHHESLIIEVTDTGPGISAEDQAHIFEEFSRLDNPTTRTQSGTGLGLAICKQLVQGHGSELKINSTLGQGSIFYFALPITTEAPPASSTPANKTPANKTPEYTAKPALDPAAKPAAPTLLMPSDILGQYTVLIVDDDAINRMVLRGILSLHQYRLLEASSGEQALALLKQHPGIDLVILDVMMPGMSGFETAMRMRTTHQVHHLPILFLTAKDYGEDLVRGYVAGGNDFLTKPVAKHELLTRAASHLRLLSHHREMERKLDASTLEQVAMANELKVLDNIVTSLQQEMNPDTLIFSLLDQMLKIITTASGASFWQLNEDATLMCSAALVQGHRHIGDLCFKCDSALLTALLTLAQSTASIQPLQQLLQGPLQSLSAFFESPETTLIAPVTHQNRLLGFIALTHSTQLPQIDPSILQALQRIKSHICSVILKVQLLRQE